MHTDRQAMESTNSQSKQTILHTETQTNKDTEKPVLYIVNKI